MRLRHLCFIVILSDYCKSPFSGYVVQIFVSRQCFSVASRPSHISHIAEKFTIGGESAVGAVGLSGVAYSAPVVYQPVVRL